MQPHDLVNTTSRPTHSAKLKNTMAHLGSKLVLLAALLSAVALAAPRTVFVDDDNTIAEEALVRPLTALALCSLRASRMCVGSCVSLLTNG